MSMLRLNKICYRAHGDTLQGLMMTNHMSLLSVPTYFMAFELRTDICL